MCLCRTRKKLWKTFSILAGLTRNLFGFSKIEPREISCVFQGIFAKSGKLRIFLYVLGRCSTWNIASSPVNAFRGTAYFSMSFGAQRGYLAIMVEMFHVERSNLPAHICSTWNIGNGLGWIILGRNCYEMVWIVKKVFHVEHFEYHDPTIHG